jgi:hypothetical protein
VQPLVNPPSAVHRALAISAVLHAVFVITAWKSCDSERDNRDRGAVDIEIAPEAPPVEALPAEVVKQRTEDLAGRKDPDQLDDTKGVPDKPADEGFAMDAGVADTPVDTPPDTPPDSPPKPPDATPLVAVADAGVGEDAQPDAEAVAIEDAQPDADPIALADAGVDAGEDAQIAAVDPWATEGSGSGTGSGSAEVGTGSGSGSGSGGLGGEQVGSGSGIAGTTNDPAVDGAATTAGTAANLLAYFPAGHEVTALIRFDRLRGTEWAAQTERLLRPMPDYRVLFGPRDAKIFEKLETLVISTPAPRDATATTLVGRTRLNRGALRDFLSAATPIAWSGAKGGLLGKRTGRSFPGDKRLFLSPFDGWFLLAQPSDIAGLTAAAPGSVDTIVATAKLPPWLAGIRKIENESGGDQKGPALVLTIGTDGSKLSTGSFEPVLGVADVQLPERVSLAMELVKQGWLVRGNMRFKDAAAATAFVSQVTTVQTRIVGASRVYEQLVGKSVMNVVKRFQFTRSGQRVSYTTSFSIADARTLMGMAAAQLDAYYQAPPP